MWCVRGWTCLSCSGADAAFSAIFCFALFGDLFSSAGMSRDQTRVVLPCHGRRHDRLRAVGEHITWLYVFVSERRIFVLWARGHWREAYRPIACKENGIFWLMRKYNSERTTGPRSVPPNLPEIHARSRPGDRRRPRVVTVVSDSVSSARYRPFLRRESIPSQVRFSGVRLCSADPAQDFGVHAPSPSFNRRRPPQIAG